MHQAQWATPAINLVLGVEELDNGNRIALYPNPADVRLNVRLAQPLANAADLLIRDVTGKTLLHQQVAAGRQHFEIATQNFNPGIYYLSVQTKDGTATFRFVVQH